MTRKTFVNITFWCMLLSIPGVILMLVETWYPLGDIVHHYLGYFGDLLGKLWAIATVWGLTGWCLVGSNALERRFKINNKLNEEDYE